MVRSDRWYWYIVKIHYSGEVQFPVEFDDRDAAENFFDNVIVFQRDECEPYMVAATSCDHAVTIAAYMFREELRKEREGLRAFQYIRTQIRRKHGLEGISG